MTRITTEECLHLRDEVVALAHRAAFQDWEALLSKRKRDELEFHNLHRNRERTNKQSAYDAASERGNKRYYSTVRMSQQYVERWLAKHVPGNVFLDYACGEGTMAIRAAREGAALAVGIDLSDVSIKNARTAADQAGVASSCVFVQTDCEKTGLPDASVDVVLCSGMLHHLDLSYAYPELRRIVKPGGRILAVEALGYNPLINAYRRLTTRMRTEWERRHILSLADVRFARRFFDVGELRFWHIAAPLVAFVSPPSLRAVALNCADRADQILTRLPGLRLLAWQFTFELIRRHDE